MERTIQLVVVAVFALPASISSSWVGEGYHPLQGVPVTHHLDPHLISAGAGHSLHDHSAHIVPYHGPLALPVVLPSGHLADTPEVSHAKHHHLSAVAQARADQYYKGHSEQGYGGAYGYTGSYHGYAVPVVLPSGHIADTHEVAAAKSAHLLAVAKAKADKYYSGHGYGYGHGYGDHEYGYSGSFHGYGIPVVLPSGHIADTHEVAAAKSAHLLAVAHAKQQEAYHYYDDSSRHYEHLPEPYHYPLYHQYHHY